MRCSDLHHIDVRRDIRQYSLHMGQAPGQHGQPVGHLDLIVLHDIHQVRHNFRHIDLPHIHASVFHEQPVNILVELPLVRPLFELADPQHSLLDQSHIAQRHTLHGLSDHLPVVLREPAHHPHIDPDDLAVPDLHIAGMRVRVEETVIHDLLDVIVHQLAPDLL